jgi:hypothetical protein
MSGNISEQEREELKLRMIAQIDGLFKEIDDAGVVRNAEQLRKTELKIAAITDGMAGEVIKAVLKHSLQDQDLIAQGRLLAKGATVRMKNHGKRDVEIQPYRGDPFTVETTYYYKAGQSHRPVAKKKGSFPS